MSWIMTYSGVHFPLLEPKVEAVKLEDIAHALSLNCRYTGHTKFLYSVAQHCLLGAMKMMEDGQSFKLQLYFMLHDASEAYANDIARPLKPLLTNYYEIEDKIQSAVWKAFGMPEPTEDEWRVVKYYDDLMLANEIPKLMPNPNEFEVEIRDDGIEIVEYSPKDVEETFTWTVIELLKRVIEREQISYS